MLCNRRLSAAFEAISQKKPSYESWGQVKLIFNGLI
jgi:hypothetical protein